jgi:hypothetical protein
MKIAMGLTLAVAALAGGWYITADGSTTNEAAADPGTLRTAAVVRRDVGATVLAIAATSGPPCSPPASSAPRSAPRSGSAPASPACSIN